MADGCPDDNLLAAWADGRLTVEQAALVSTHLDECARCRDVYAEVAHGPAAPPARLLAPAARSAVVKGELVGPYEVGDELGAGGMGVVVRARHRQLHTEVALKFVRRELADDPDVVSRFSREARAACRLRSAHANKVFDLGTLADGSPYMVMEYLEGETLEARVRRLGPAPEADVRRWMLQALDALAEAHGLGIVHRDLKPANLFLRRLEGREVLVVLDFGVAKSVNADIEHGLQQSVAHRLVGSPAYMAPEQLSPGQPVDARADLWALGCTMHTLLAGAPPFDGKDLLELAWNVRTAPPRPLPASCSPGLRACIERCLAKQPEQRWPSATALAAALAPAPLPPPRGRRRAPLVLGVVGAVGLGVFGWRLRPTTDGLEGLHADPPAPLALRSETSPTPLPAPPPLPVVEPPKATVQSAPGTTVPHSPRRPPARANVPAPDGGRDDDLFDRRL